MVSALRHKPLFPLVTPITTCSLCLSSVGFQELPEVSNNYLLIYCLIFLGKDFLEKINPVGTGGLNSWSQ